jgi:small-conductance mechanosensitive channel
MLFRELNFEIAPIFASAGIVGLAIRFGAQSLVKDVITGAFIFLEHQ